ncbi:MAG TPA: hypothetical protein VK668_22295 [Mucilaginibacter sp.]|nr:hypothetical protein [Mucilaginibacter sp.]
MTTKKFITVRTFLKTAILLLVLALPAKKLFAQAEFRPWGNLDGIRIKGQLIPFNTSIVVEGDNSLKASHTGKELQKPVYTRDGDEQSVVTSIGDLQFIETMKDNGHGSAKLTIRCVVKKDTIVKGIYFHASLPVDRYAQSQFKIDNSGEKAFDQSKLNQEGEYVHAQGKEISFTIPTQSIQIKSDTTSLIFGRPDTGANKFIQLYFPVCSGNLHKNDVFERTYEIRVSGDIDQSPATLKLDTSVQGRPFAGMGGNFRLQNAKTDPQVIDYCLKNMRVAWGRIEMPWRNWQPDSAMDPLAVDTANLNPHVRQSMQMAQRLSQMHIPVILTAWMPPKWAVTGKLSFGKSPEGIWGNPLDRTKLPLIYQSITDYIIYLKDHYGVDVKYFSFNESDLGINIRQTGEEHDDLIKGLGAYFVSKGLKTKLLLGDNSDANTYSFIYPAMNDAAARPFMGAVSFHSWRGWETGTLQKWADAAKQTNLPLIVGEGSIDAAAWAYPAYFEDPSYALEEINLYTRLLAICQPLSILQWQLTADYSPLKGGGIFGDNSPLQPTQRFWNLKQLASTPEGLFAMPITTDKDAISCAALGDNAKHSYTIHLVNNGASREVHLTGLPASITKLTVYITDHKKDMKKSGSIKVKDHECTFKLNERCFTTLFSE